MKMKSHKYLVLTIVLLSFVTSVFGIKAINKVDTKVIDEDQKKRYWAYGKHGFYMSNLEKAAGDLRKQTIKLIPYISKCERFPLNLEDAYKPIENAPKACRPLKPWDFGIVTPWIDPWGRPFQIRYDKERRKLQMRSQGRRLNDPSDDIVRETLWGNSAIIFNKEIEKCKKLSSDDKNCVFNRGWH